MKESTGSQPLLLLPSTFLLLLFSSLFRSASSFKSVSILLNCGESHDDVDANNRKWTNDSSTLFGPSNSQSSFSAQASNTTPPSLPPAVLYRTARIFTSASSYHFTALPNGRHFVRLHFFPTVYNDRDPRNAFFSVTAGPYTLTAHTLTQAYIMCEFFLTVPTSGSLNLTFIPSPSVPHSFAFINGIEIVSSQELFLSDAYIVSTNRKFLVRDSDTLQTVVRLNVGGSYIPPTLDAGLSRTWYDDSSHTLDAAFGVSYGRDNDVSIRYSNVVPDYIAPANVYGTARSMGPDTSVNLNYNLTWFINVDNGFWYLMRLHFCEIQSQVYDENQRVFSVYVNKLIADRSFDVILKAKRKVKAPPPYTGVAVYEDYMVEVPSSSDKPSGLWIEVHPNLDANPYYADAILNGLEVFKVGETPSLNIDHLQGGDRRLIIAGIVGVTAAAFVIGACFYCLLRKCHQKEKGSVCGLSIILMHLLPYAQEKNRKSPTSSTGKSMVVLSNASNGYRRYFTLSEIVAATNNFDNAILLGIGGFGKVYKGEIDNGTKLVAIKRGNQLSEQGACEFTNEIEMLSKLRHRHLVSLIGYCDDNFEMILVYNYMAHGTLRQHLYGANQPPLPWRRRLEICMGAAKGLHYLHAGATYTLIHRDVKTTNILLDENWEAKVSYFGLSRMGTSLDCSHVSTGVKGTFGYFDPEYFRLHRLTEKSDVYSFGVVMLEILCARPVIDMSRAMEEVSLAGWALHYMREGRTEHIIDRFLDGKIAPECLQKFAETAEKCLAEKGVDRPSMANVVSSLEVALSLQISKEEGNKEEQANNYMLDLYGDENDDGASISWTPCPMDKDGSKSTVDVREIYEVNQLG